MLEISKNSWGELHADSTCFERGKEARGPQLRSDFHGLSGKIGILGGTFDPPHLGHLILAKRALEVEGLDTVFFLPTRHNPLKAPPAADTAERLDMLLLLLDSPDLQVNSLELEMPEARCTIDVIRKIKEQAAPESELFFIIGADILPHLHEWLEIHELFTLVTFVTFPRGGQGKEIIPTLPWLREDEKRSLSEHFIVCKEIPLSSSAIRNGAASSESLEALVTPAVAHYMHEKRLYK